MRADRAELPRAYRITRVHVENATTRSFVLDGSMEAAPGQFVMAWLPGLDEKPFSLTGPDPITLTVHQVGPFTTAMQGLSAGERLWLRGPFGQGFALHPGTLLIIGGGCGLPPLLFLAQVARRQGLHAHAVLGARTAEDLFFQEQFSALGCAVHIATDDGSLGLRGTSVEAASRLLRDGRLSAPALYACGPEPMLDAAYALAQTHRLTCQLSYEAYMRCGVGVCGSCARGGCLVCRDGPVFGRPPTAGQVCT